MILRWHVQNGNGCIAKSKNVDRVRQNLDIFDFSLTGEEMDSFDGLNVGWRHYQVLWEAHHPDYPFKDELPVGFTKMKPPARSEDQHQDKK